MTVLDTNFLIYLLRNKDAAVVADFYDNPKITTITLFELYYGAWRSSKPQENILKISSLVKSVDILEFDKSAAEKAGEIQAGLMNSGIPVDIQDVLIAGICIANKEELVTSDIDHFSRIEGLRCRSW
ncbi:MAG: type II toxin-antitoxin system VapC family toxin [Candidatus Methanoperedens sp.]